MKWFRTILALTVVVIMSLPITLLAGDSETLIIKATVPMMSGLNTTVSRVIGDTWTEVGTTMDLGTLEWDPADGIFRSQEGRYFAVDVGVLDNTNDWTLQHGITPISNGVKTLDANVNVTFMDEDGAAGVEIDKLSYGDSNGQTFSKTDFSTGNWLRIYYGLANGKTDAPGVDPITIEKPSGNYSGTITLTLTP